MNTRTRNGFTLIELLVVVTIIALLLAILLPSLNRAQKQAKNVVCQTHLKEIGNAFLIYSSGNSDVIIPSYNMSGTGSTVNGEPAIDGWASILYRDGILKCANQDQLDNSNVFVSPLTLPRYGLTPSQTGSDPLNRMGYQDWPWIRGQNAPALIPTRGFDKIIRVGYWINADNPIGTSAPIVADQFYTCSVGYTPDSGVTVMRQNKYTNIRRPSQLITLSNGLYAGRQGDCRLTNANGRVGYYQSGGNWVANTAFADGHVSTVAESIFPRTPSGTTTTAMAQQDNLGSGPTIYCDPERSLP